MTERKPHRLNVVALIKSNEKYVFLFVDSKRMETLRAISRFASNPELSLTWGDAAVLSQKVTRAK